MVLKCNMLVVDDDGAFRKEVRQALPMSYGIAEAGTEEEARRLIHAQRFDLVILDMRLKTEREGLALLREIHRLDALQAVIIVSAFGDTESYLEAIEAGAVMFLHKQEFTPPLLARMVDALLEQSRLRRQVRSLEERLDDALPAQLVGASPAIARARQQCIAAATSSPRRVILLGGEGGTGRSLAARIIHKLSPQHMHGPLVSVSAGDVARNISSRPPSEPPARRLYEAVALASGGLLHIRGIDETTSDDRAALLAAHSRAGDHILVLSGEQESVEAIAADVDSASIPLMEIVLPPLRDRRQDIALLAQYFLTDLTTRGATTASGLSREASSLLQSRPWLGNVRELRATIELSAMWADAARSQVVEAEHLPGSAPDADGPIENGSNYRLVLAEAELQLVSRAIQKLRTSVKTDLAAGLGYADRHTFSRRLKKTLREFPFLGRRYADVTELFTKKSNS